MKTARILENSFAGCYGEKRGAQAKRKEFRSSFARDTSAHPHRFWDFHENREGLNG